MTQRPLRPCNKFCCGNLTKSTYCDEHKQEYSNQHRYYDKHQRDKRADKFYHSSAWMKARDIVKIRDNGLCQGCLKDKKITVGVIVDHVIPIKQDWNKRLELDNLQLLCQPCHNVKTGEERTGKNKNNRINIVRARANKEFS